MVGHYACEERIHRLRDFESRLEGACINGGQSESRSALRPFLNRLRLQDDIHRSTNFNLNFASNPSIEKDKDTPQEDALKFEFIVE